MTADDIQALVTLLERYGIAEFEYEDGKRRLTLSLDPPMAAPVAVPPVADVTEAAKPAVHAPSVGLFHAMHPLAAEENRAPRTVEAGEIVAYLQIGQVLTPVLAPQRGTLGPALVEEGAVTGYGTRLFDYL